jgi:hypothetical protein
MPLAVAVNTTAECLRTHCNILGDNTHAIIIIIFIIVFITFKQGIYNYIRETNHVSKIYSVAAVFYNLCYT